MLSKSVKISVLSLFAVAFAAEAFAQATINSMDQNADQSQGQYQPMDMGYAGFNSLGMMQSAWLIRCRTSAKGRANRLIRNITGRRIWFCRCACARA